MKQPRPQIDFPYTYIGVRSVSLNNPEGGSLNRDETDSTGHPNSLRTAIQAQKQSASLTKTGFS
jgi:hypothetical protein